ncbi:Vitellogenin-1 [Gryllus bimaculatus]|nr:Vitellogenin-1 [Gryllus bimaculatus]
MHSFERDVLDSPGGKGRGEAAAAAAAAARGARSAAGAGANGLEAPPPDPQGYGTRWMYIPDGEGVPRVAFLEPPTDDGCKNKIEGQRIYVNNTQSLRSSYFDASKPTYFLVHGWLSSELSTTVTNLRDAYLSVGDYNVVAVDWSSWASSSTYWWSKISVPAVGELLGQLAIMMTREGAKARDMHLVGHSLGAHVVGAAGSILARHDRGARITGLYRKDRFQGAFSTCLTAMFFYVLGLDPALPGFQYYEYAEGRLDETDGEFVQVIHTCSGALGYTSPIGHADFYPNNGTPMQPGCCCMPEVVQACSHARAHEYFAESIVSEVGFYAVNCATWDEYVNKKCSSNKAVLMGEKTPRSARGMYFLSTNSSSPFALGLEDWMEASET